MGLFKSHDEKMAERLQENISSELMKTKNLVDGFAVAFCDGVATLSGTCDTPKTKKKAILFAEMAEGVTGVQAGQLRISENYVDPSTDTESSATSSAEVEARTAPPEGESKPETSTVSQAAPSKSAAASARVQPEGRSVQPEESDEAENRLYTIQSGDTLSAIAKQFYGDANKYMVIFEANPKVLKDPNTIYPGQEIRIPPLQ